MHSICRDHSQCKPIDDGCCLKQPLCTPLLILCLFQFWSYLSAHLFYIVSVLPFTLTPSLSLAGSQGKCCCTRAPQAWASTSLAGRMEKASSSPSSWQAGRLTWVVNWGGVTGFSRSVSQHQTLCLPHINNCNKFESVVRFLANSRSQNNDDRIKVVCCLISQQTSALMKCPWARH